MGVVPCETESCAIIYLLPGLEPFQTRHDDDVAAATGPAGDKTYVLIFQYLAASVNSASTSCPLGNRPCAPASTVERLIVTAFSAVRSARAVTTSAGSRKLSTKSSIRTAWTRAGAPVMRRLRAGRRPSWRCSRPDAPSRPACRRARKRSPGRETRRRSRGRPRPGPRARASRAAANRRCAGSRCSGRSTARSGWTRLLPAQQQLDEAVEPRQCFT